MGNSGDSRYGGDPGGGPGRGPGREPGRGRDYRDQQDRGGGGGYRDDQDRGFLDRAGDEFRSWFGDDDAQRRREMDQRRWEQEQRMTGRRDNDRGPADHGRDYGRDDRGRSHGGDGGPGTLGGGGFGTGWGNQRAESWNRDRPGERGWYGAGSDQERGDGGRHYGPGEREGWFTDSRGGERGERYGGSGASGGSGRSEGFGGDALRGVGGGGLHDPHYSEWRQRQIDDFDRDYEDYRREHQSRFEQEFGSWRAKRQGQRQSLARVAEHMDVVGSDGSHVGTVDKVRGDRIILTKTDPAASGAHHSVPCSWVEKVEDKVVLNRSADQARSGWHAEGENQTLFREGRDGGDDGPRNLNRSFSGTYEEGRDGGRDDRDG
jgi:hypothetical protein